MLYTKPDADKATLRLTERLNLLVSGANIDTYSKTELCFKEFLANSNLMQKFNEFISACSVAQCKRQT